VVERGQAVEAAARKIGLTPARVRELVEEERDRRELKMFRCDSIPVERTRRVIAEVLARDPDLTIRDIARWLDMRQIDFERAFLGKGRDGRPKTRVSVSSASRLMIALGRALAGTEQASAGGTSVAREAPSQALIKLKAIPPRYTFSWLSSSLRAVWLTSWRLRISRRLSPLAPLGKDWAGACHRVPGICLLPGQVKHTST
jgi:hypothetical protein